MHTFVIEPIEYIGFDDEAEQIEKCQEWGLLSEKASKSKTFHYKGSGKNLTCSVVGYVDDITAVIEFDTKQKHCIHPSFLKEMQASNFGQRLVTGSEDSADAEPSDDAAEPESQKPVPVAIAEEAVDKPKPVSAPTKEKAKAPKKVKLQLPEEKVKMTATVQQFTTVPNNFSDTDDEVIVYEAVKIVEPEIEVGAAWSSHSATLKKLELAVGDTITFDAKIVAKKLTKHPVQYKINNPAKIQKS